MIRLRSGREEKMDRFAQRQEILQMLNAPEAGERLGNLEILLSGDRPGSPERIFFKGNAASEKVSGISNQHIHTTYSFSPYSPTAAIYCAREEGLQIAGIVDHDTVAGADEFCRAGKLAGLKTTCGMECRVSFAGTGLEGRILNNPDQVGIAYMVLYRIPASGFGRLTEIFSPLRGKRNLRNRGMTDNINVRMEPWGIGLDYDRDVLPLSQYADGGTVTERHLLYALSRKVAAHAGREACGEFVEKELKIVLSEQQMHRLSNPGNVHFLYDLLGVMKAELMEKIYIPASDECLPLGELVRLSDEIGATLCYAYLGDEPFSIVGDKRTVKFEDDFLEELFGTLKEYGVHGVTCIPSRNTREQKSRVRELCCRYDLIEIASEEINSSRQRFG